MATSARAKPQNPSEPPSRTRYEDDLYTWVQEQVALLRAGKFDEIDASNIAEELGDVAKAEFRSLVSAIALVVPHLLKWDYQPGRRSRSWELSVREHRDQILDTLADNPGLKSRLRDALARGYKYGRLGAMKETKFADDAIPDVCPYTFDEMMTREIEFGPKPVAKRTSPKPR
jgi:hypothetical protein